jgi:hypothetical protein
MLDWTQIEHFKSYETKCKCGCGKNNPSIRLMSFLDSLRNYLGRPVNLRSVCRCFARNESEGGALGSSHTNDPTDAVDIEVLDSKTRFEVLEYAIKSDVVRIGIAKTFIHVDFDRNKSQKISWLY